MPRREGGHSLVCGIREPVANDVTTLRDLVVGSQYRLYCDDPQMRFRTRGQLFTVPSTVVLDVIETPGTTLVFSTPVPSDGVVLWAALDRGPVEPKLAGEVPIRDGAVEVFVPLGDLARGWFVDACGEGWNLVVPVCIATGSVEHTVHTVTVADDVISTFVEFCDGISGSEIVFMRPVTDHNGVEFHALSKDPLAKGERVVYLENGAVIRGMTSHQALLAHLTRANCVMTVDLSGNRFSLRWPEIRPGTIVFGPDRAAIDEDVSRATSRKVSWWLDQRIGLLDRDMWYPVLGQDDASALLAGRVSLPTLTGGEYRVRILGTRKWVVPVR